MMPAVSNLLHATRTALNPARPAAAMQQVAVSAVALVGSALVPPFEGRKYAPPPFPRNVCPAWRAPATLPRTATVCWRPALPTALPRMDAPLPLPACRGGAEGHAVVAAAVAAAQLEPAGCALLRTVESGGPEASARRPLSPPTRLLCAMARCCLARALSPGRPPPSSPACPPTHCSARSPGVGRRWRGKRRVQSGVRAGEPRGLGVRSKRARLPQPLACAPLNSVASEADIPPRRRLRDRCTSMYLGAYVTRSVGQQRVVLPAAIRRWVREPTGFLPRTEAVLLKI